MAQHDTSAHLPEWLQPHLFPGKKFADLTVAELSDLKERLSRFRDEQPEVSVVIPAKTSVNSSSQSAAKTDMLTLLVVATSAINHHHRTGLVSVNGATAEAQVIYRKG